MLAFFYIILYIALWLFCLHPTMVKYYCKVAISCHVSIVKERATNIWRYGSCIKSETFLLSSSQSQFSSLSNADGDHCACSSWSKGK